MLVSTTITAKEKASLEKLLQEALYQYDLPGLSIGCKRDDDPVQIITGGYSNYVKKTVLTSHHVFHMASISKLFTASGVIQLALNGAFSLDTPLKTLLPWFTMLKDPATEDGWRRITPRQILSHTSGLPDVTDYHWEIASTSDTALVDYCQSIDVTRRTLLWPPEDCRFSYSNIGYELMGALIQEYSGLSFEQYMEENFFIPLGMGNATFKTYERTGDGTSKISSLEKAGVVVPHGKNARHQIQPEPHFPYHRGHGPSSTLTATMEDVLLWGHSWQNSNPVISKLFQRENPWAPIATVPNNGEEIGLGWFIRKEGELTFYGHEGSDDGFRSSLWICPEKKWTILVCANITKAPVKKINKEVSRILLDYS